MSKRWEALPRGIRWLVGGIAAVVLALAIAWVLFVPAADWLAHHDVGSAKGALLQAARDAARGRLLTLGAGLFAAGALVFTARNFTLSRRTVEITEQGQVTDRYTKAIGQLGSKKLDVRIGGIYALERVARDSPRDHPTVMEVLSAFVRDHSHEPWPPPAPDESGAAAPKRVVRPEVQAAVTVIGRNARHDHQRLSLAGANLTGAFLAGQRLSLAGAFLAGANLAHADLTGADLAHADLTGADLTGALLTDADLAHADLTHADLAGANLAGANLSNVDLTGAWLGGADLTTLTLGAADVASAYLGGARWPGDVPVPGGWQRDAHSGRLKWIDTNSGGTATKLSSVEPMSHAVPPGAGDRAIAFLSNWAEGRCADVAANFDFDATFTAKFPIEKAASAWAQVTGPFGTYQRMGGEPFVRQLGDYTVVDVPMEFEAGVRRGSVFFNADGQVSGLFIVNPGTGER